MLNKEQIVELQRAIKSIEYLGCTYAIVAPNDVTISSDFEEVHKKFIQKKNKDSELAASDSEEAQRRRAIARMYLFEFTQQMQERIFFAKQIDGELRILKSLMLNWVAVNKKAQDSLTGFYDQALNDNTLEYTLKLAELPNLANSVNNALAAEIDEAFTGLNMRGNAIFNYHRKQARTPESCELDSEDQGRNLIKHMKQVARTIGIDLTIKQKPKAA
jgi:uncharacterized protein YnzC (UPF0291/DUF896 family)